MPATGLDTAASHPRRPVPGAGSGLPSLGMGTGRDTGPALFPAASPGLARLPPPPLPRRRAPGTGEEGGQQHQHQHRNRHVDEQSNGGGRGRSGADGPQRRQRSAGGGTGGRGGRWGWEEPGRRGRRDLGATGREDPVGLPPEREGPGTYRRGRELRTRRGERWHPWGWRRRETWGGMCYRLHLRVWGGGRHLRGWRRDREPPLLVLGERGVEGPERRPRRASLCLPHRQVPVGSLIPAVATGNPQNSR